MDLRKEFEKERGYDCYAYRQDYAGGEQYVAGFMDEYVEWLESKVNDVSNSFSHEIIEKIRNSKSDAEARRHIKHHVKNCF